MIGQPVTWWNARSQRRIDLLRSDNVAVDFGDSCSCRGSDL